MDAASSDDQQWNELQALRQRLAALEAAGPTASNALQHTQDALQVAEDELRAQNEELRAARDALEQERARYAALFTLAPDGYLVTDTAGVLQEVNQAAATLLGRPAEYLVGKPLVLYVTPPDRRTVHTLLACLRRQTRVQDWEIHLQPRRDHPVPVSLTVATEQSCQGYARCLYWLVHDLRAHRQAEAERQSLAREAQRAQHFALLGRLAAGVSHEIRNPLGAIVLHVDLLEEELRQPAPDSAEQLPRALAEIRTQLARLDDLVQDYLSLVRVSSIKCSLEDLGAIVRSVTEELAGALAASGIVLHMDGCDQLGTVAVHKNTFRRALLNLVQNAIEAMPQGGVLSLQCRRDATQIQLEVCDAGAGISPELCAQIFEPLYTTKPGGTGLGLYIVQEVLAAHGGTVAVQSVAGQGTTFTLTLPVAPDAPA